jgi:hypothetical protein
MTRGTRKFGSMVALAAIGIATAAFALTALSPLEGMGPSAAAQETTPKVLVLPPKTLAQVQLWRPGASEEDAWRIAQARNSIAAYEAFMRDYPSSRHFNTARDRRRALLAMQEEAKTVDRGVVTRPPVIVAPPPPSPPSPPPPPPMPPPAQLPPVVQPPPKSPPIKKVITPPKSSAPMETRSLEQNAGEAPTTAAPSPTDSVAAPRTTTMARPPAPGMAPGAGGGTGAAPVRTALTAVMTELLPPDARRAQNGGAAMVLLTNAPAQQGRNLALCRALWTQLESATTDEVATGVRKVDGVVQILRPVYWFMRANRQPTSTGPEVCETRLANYHFARASTILQRMQLTGTGPWLAVVRTDDRAAGVIDLSRATDAELSLWVRYFKDSYSKRDRIWAPETNTPEAVQRDLIAFFGDSVVRTLTAAPRAVFRPQ